MTEEWRIIQRTRGSTLKQLWARLRSGLWVPTGRVMLDAQMMPPIMGGGPGVVEKQTAAGGDDGYIGAASFNNTNDYMIGGYYGEALDIFARWIEVTMEGTIDVSHITVYYYSNAGSPKHKVHVVDEDDPLAPTSRAEFVADPLTDAGVDWDGLWTGTWNQSPSLNPAFQEYVDTFGPIVNKAVMVQIKNDSSPANSRNICYSWEWSNHSRGAKLHIEYSLAVVRRIFITQQ